MKSFSQLKEEISEKVNSLDIIKIRKKQLSNPKNFIKGEIEDIFNVDFFVEIFPSNLNLEKFYDKFKLNPPQNNLLVQYEYKIESLLFQTTTNEQLHLINVFLKFKNNERKLCDYRLIVESFYFPFFNDYYSPSGNFIFNLTKDKSIFRFNTKDFPSYSSYLSEEIEFKDFNELFHKYPKFKNSKILSEQFMFKKEIRCCFKFQISSDFIEVIEIKLPNNQEFVYKTMEFVSVTGEIDFSSVDFEFRAKHEFSKSDMKNCILMEKEDILLHLTVPLISNGEFFDQKLVKNINNFHHHFNSPLHKNFPKSINFSSNFDKKYNKISDKFESISIYFNEIIQFHINTSRDYTSEFRFAKKNKISLKFYETNGYLQSDLNFIFNLANMTENFIKNNGQWETYKVVTFNATVEENFITFNGTSSYRNILLRLPLHPRDNIELFIDEEFNSIFDLNLVKTLKMNQNLGNLDDLCFRFE